MILDIISQFWYVWAFFVGFFVVARKRKKEEVGKKEIIVIGHRGACGYEYENTRESFIKALDLGADYIECDVRRTLDGKFFLSHTDKVTSNEKKTRKISQTKANALLNLVSKEGRKLISIEEYIKIIPKDKHFFDLKIKGCEFDFLALLREHELTEKCLITSHYADSLRLLKVLEPRLRTGLSFPKDRFAMPVKLVLSPLLTPAILLVKHTYPFYLGFLANYAKADFIAVNFRFFLTKRLVKAAHKRNLLVFPFKVNNIRNIRRMIKLGVDGIISDYPERVKEIMMNQER